ncbi:MAG: hypothetical protein GEV04_20015 [Actinophytocola sp.]|nr:hypothetical protein [Actinophytocola sp.]
MSTVDAEGGLLLIPYERMADRRFVIDLPWSSLGGRRAADVSAFADWSLRDTVPASTHDTLPDTGSRRMTLR